MIKAKNTNEYVFITTKGVYGAKIIRKGENTMRLILTEEERALRKTFEPYYDVLKTPSLSPDAPEEAVKAYKKYNELYDKKRAEAEAWLLETKVTFNRNK